MKKLALVLAAGVALSAGPAFAKSFTGVVEAIDRDRGIVMMEDGSEFYIPEGERIGNFAPGTEVTIRFNDEFGDKSIESMYEAEPRNDDEIDDDQ